MRLQGEIRREGKSVFVIQEIDKNRLYPIQLAADLWGVSPSTVYMAARMGKIKTVKLGGRRMISGEELLRVKEEGWR